MKIRFGLISLFILLTFFSLVQAATITSANSGYWNDIGTWVGGAIPSAADLIVISSGQEVLFDKNDISTTCGPITINNGGTLRFASTPSDPKTMQVKGDINVYGKLELVPGSTLKMECETNGQYGIIVQSGGELKGTGSVPTVLTTLSAPLNIGDTTISVTNSSGFGKGDIITLGDDANAEGFTIFNIAGNQITLNRKALNAQITGAEVYKNATVTTSNISVGSKAFTVADLGGIKAGDKIAVATTLNYYETEFATVESVSPNTIVITQPFSYSHNSGAIAVKTNRNALITSAKEDKTHNGYLYNKGNLNLNFLSLTCFGDPENDSERKGLALDKCDKISIRGCSINNIQFGLYSFYNMGGSNVSNICLNANLFFENHIGNISIYSSYYNSLLSNISFYDWMELSGEGNLTAFNYAISSGWSCGSLNFNGSENLGIFNNCIYNSTGIQMAGTSSSIIAYNIISFNNDNGIYFYNGSDKNYFINNLFEQNDVGFQIGSGWDKPEVYLFNEYFDNSSMDISFYPYSSNYKIRLNMRNSIFKSGVEFKELGSGYILSDKHNAQKGQTKIWGNYDITSTEAKQFNYTDQSYPSSAINPILFRGSNHTIITPETTDASTTTEVWFVTYRSATGNWEVKGTESSLQSNRANSGVAYASDNNEVKFTITQDNPQEGDQFVFATIAAAGDANTQKKILFGPSAIKELNNQSRLVVEKGGKLELKGTAEYPTLIDYDGAGGYGLVISGEIEADYFDVNQINSDGIKLDPSAKITKFDNGSIRNVSGLGPHLSVTGIKHTFTNVDLDNTGAYDVKAENGSDLQFKKSQRGRFLDLVLDTSAVSWDNPVVGYTQDNIVGSLAYEVDSQTLTIPFKIRDPYSSDCSFKGNSFQYSQDGGKTWHTVADENLSGIDKIFSSNADFASAPEYKIYWNVGQNYSNLEAKLSIRFRVKNDDVYTDYGSSEAISFNIKSPVISLLYPNGGELFRGGQKVVITWVATDEGSGVADNSIDIYCNNGADDVLIAENQPNIGSYNWTIPAINGENYKLKIVVYDNVGESAQDLSDKAFSVDSIAPTQPTVNNLKSPTLLDSQLISGWRSSDTKYVYVNSSCEAISYPDINTWTYLASLKQGNNTFVIYAQDEAGNNSEPEIATIEAVDKVVSNDDGSISVELPVGSVTEEIKTVYFSRIDLPSAPMRGAKAFTDAYEIIAVGENYNDILELKKDAEITIDLGAAPANPRYYLWDATLKKWDYFAIKNLKKQGNKITFQTSKLGLFAVFDVLDTQKPKFLEFKVNELTIAKDDSINDLPNLSFQINDDYGVDSSQLGIKVDNALISQIAEKEAKSQSVGFTVSMVGNSAKVQYAFPAAAKLALGHHNIELIAYDEVGNSASYSIGLFVVGSTVSGLMVYPNPYNPNTGQLKFDGLSGNVTVCIYSISGDMVWKGFTSGAASIAWDGKNHKGNEVAAGVYYYVVKDDKGGKSVGKIAVVK